MDSKQDEKIIIFDWLAHHDPKQDDFNDHVFYIFNHAICIGCFSFLLGATVALIIGNVFYYFINNFSNFSIILLIFFLCWIPSLIQYTIQIVGKKSLRNRALKFLVRFLYPIGCIILIFKVPILGFILSIPAGYLVIYLRKYYHKRVKSL